MKLDNTNFENYLEFQCKLNPQTNYDSLKNNILEELGDGYRDINLTRIGIDENNDIYAVIRLYPFTTQTWILSELHYLPQTNRTKKLLALELIPESISIARNFNVEKIETRINQDSIFEEYRELLKNSGFVFTGLRIEYRTPVGYLPSEQGSPLKWIEVDEEIFPEAAEVLERCRIGDPDWDEDDNDSQQFIISLLGEKGLNNSLDCIHLGLYQGEYIALVFSQVAPATGWSRITYMGLIPPFRGKGLGKWVHRHGFQMIREQQGVTYQGGCSSGNIPMISLFKDHNCKEFCRYEQWVWAKERVDWYIENMFRHNY
jgi:GNAT superfamily N-acetyltransferase